jgi:hypothetical protein
MKKSLTIIALCVVFLGSFSFAQKITFIKSGEGLLPGGWLKSANGNYLLTLKKDGNFELTKAGKAIWSTNTAGKPVKQAFMQSDGNFVLKGADGKVYWQTKTTGHPGSSLKLADSGNIYVNEDIYSTDYEGNKNYVKSVGVWTSNTSGK